MKLSRHSLVHVADLKILTAIIGRMENNVARDLEGPDFIPEPRTPMRSANATSKVETIRVLIHSLEYIADAIDTHKEIS